MCIKNEVKMDIRPAQANDIEAIAKLFASDEFGHGDEWNDENIPAYQAAFELLQKSSDSNLYVVIDERCGEVMGTFMLTFTPVFYGRGAHRVILEGVQVASTYRGQGVGRFILGFTEREAHILGAKSVVLTSSKKRIDAHRFYESNGYIRSHDGFKKILSV